MFITIKEAIDALGVEISSVSGEMKDLSLCITTDSRSSGAENIFIALKGEKCDGHDYLLSALENKTEVFIINENHSEKIEKAGVFIIFVRDTLTALHKIARYCRNKSKAKVIAVTGSNGKTTTKNILAHAIEKRFKTYYSPRSFNNHIGVPLSILSAPEDTEVLILEIGMNHKGEISSLMNIANPDIGVILNVGRSHLGNFSCIDDILAAKAEMYESIETDKTIVLNGKLKDREEFNKRDDINIRYFGPEEKDLSYKLVSYSPGIKMELKGAESLTISSCLQGAHNAENIAAAVLVMKLLNIDSELISSSIGEFKGVSMRYERKKLENGITLINDAYNANPDSFAAAVENFTREKNTGRKIIIAGEMLELGEFSRECHLNLARIVNSKESDLIIGVGKATECFSEVINQEKFKWFADIDEACLNISSMVERGDLILLKGSRGNKLELLEPYIAKGKAS